MVKSAGLDWMLRRRRELLRKIHLPSKKLNFRQTERAVHGELTGGWQSKAKNPDRLLNTTHGLVRLRESRLSWQP